MPTSQSGGAHSSKNALAPAAPLLEAEARRAQCEGSTSELSIRCLCEAMCPCCACCADRRKSSIMCVPAAQPCGDVQGMSALLCHGSGWHDTFLLHYRFEHLNILAALSSSESLPLLPGGFSGCQKDCIFFLYLLAEKACARSWACS